MAASAHTDTTDAIRIVLLGKTGSGKSASGNTILGKTLFDEDLSSESVTTECQIGTAMVKGRQITVVDTPGLFDTSYSKDENRDQIIKCIYLAAPGPHVFLLVIAEGRYTQEQKNTVEMIRKMFGNESMKYTIVLFTRGDVLRKTLDEYLKDAEPGIMTLISQCGDRCHLFNNRNRSNKDQVHKLLDKVDKMRRANGGSYYTAEMFQEAEEAFKQQQERKLEEESGEEKRKKKEELGEALQDTDGGREHLTETTSDLRIILLGDTNSWRRASGNKILGSQVFKDDNTVCRKKTALVHGRQLTVIDTPNLLAKAHDEETEKNIKSCLAMAAPGPHVFLLVIELDSMWNWMWPLMFGRKNWPTVTMIQNVFGKESEKYTILLFTGDRCSADNDIRQVLHTKFRHLEDLLRQLGGRHHFFNNIHRDEDQVLTLLDKIDAMLRTNGGSYLTTEKFQRTEEALKQKQERILKLRWEEIKREKEELQAKHEVEVEMLNWQIEEERRRREKLRRRREEQFKCKEEDMRVAMLKLVQDERARRLAMKEHYERRKKKNEDWIKERISEVEMELKRQEEQWEKKKEAKLKRREKEEEERQKRELEKEKEWQNTQSQEQEKFNNKILDIIEASKEEEMKKKQEYEEQVKKMEEEQKELEDKIKYTVGSKVKELEEQMQKLEEECQRKHLEEEKRKNEESRWKSRLALMKANWEEQQRQEQERYEWEKQEEKQKREDEMALSKLDEELEKWKIRQDAIKKIEENKIRKLQQELHLKLEKNGKWAKQRAEMEAQFRQQKEDFAEQEQKETKADEERERRWMENLIEMHEKEKDYLKRKTEMAARREAETQFIKELEKNYDIYMKGYRKGHDDGYEKGDSKGYWRGKNEKK